MLVLGHGAAGGVGAPDLLALAEAGRGAGLAVARVLQPYRLAGRRAPDRAERLDIAWTAAVAALRRRPDLAGLPLVVGGRSSGSRVACRTAGPTGAAVVVALAFPLVPPTRPQRSRLAELVGAGVPVLVVQGSRDAFGTAVAVRQAALPYADVTVVEVPGADHALRRLGELAGDAVSWVLERLDRQSPTANRSGR